MACQYNVVSENIRSFEDTVAFHLHKIIHNDLRMIFQTPNCGSPCSTSTMSSESCCTPDAIEISSFALPVVDHKICRILFKHTFRNYKLPVLVSDAKVGDFVMVQSFVDRHSIDMGVIIEIYTANQFDDFVAAMGPSEDPDENKVGKILRIATKEETQYLPQKLEREMFLVNACQTFVNNRCLPMSIQGVEYQFDGNVLFIYYASKDRVDFRPLVKFLLKLYCKGTRIQLKRTCQCRHYVPFKSY